MLCLSTIRFWILCGDKIIVEFSYVSAQQDINQLEWKLDILLSEVIYEHIIGKVIAFGNS